MFAKVGETGQEPFVLAGRFGGGVAHEDDSTVVSNTTDPKGADSP
jgi:hypothetical protein